MKDHDPSLYYPEKIPGSGHLQKVTGSLDFSRFRAGEVDCWRGTTRLNQFKKKHLILTDWSLLYYSSYISESDDDALRENNRHNNSKEEKLLYLLELLDEGFNISIVIDNKLVRLTQATLEIDITKIRPINSGEIKNLIPALDHALILDYFTLRKLCHQSTYLDMQDLMEVKPEIFAQILKSIPGNDITLKLGAEKFHYKIDYLKALFEHFTALHLIISEHQTNEIDALLENQNNWDCHGFSGHLLTYSKNIFNKKPQLKYQIKYLGVTLNDVIRIIRLLCNLYPDFVPANFDDLKSKILGNLEELEADTDCLLFFNNLPRLRRLIITLGDLSKTPSLDKFYAPALKTLLIEENDDSKGLDDKNNTVTLHNLFAFTQQIKLEYTKIYMPGRGDGIEKFNCIRSRKKCFLTESFSDEVKNAEIYILADAEYSYHVFNMAKNKFSGKRLVYKSNHKFISSEIKNLPENLTQYIFSEENKEDTFSQKDKD